MTKVQLFIAGSISFVIILTSCLFSGGRHVFAGAISHPRLFIHTGIEDPLRYQYHSLLRGEMDGACAPPNDNSVLLHVKTDINGDGRDDFLVSHQDCLNGKAGNVWNVYVSAPDGFIRVPDVITVHRNTFYVVTVADSGERVIITNRRRRVIRLRWCPRDCITENFAKRHWPWFNGQERTTMHMRF
jgi:hypothetical protein